MNPGVLRARVTFQEPVETPDGFGAAGAKVWQPVAVNPTVWAEVTPLTGTEAFEAQRLAAETTHRIRVRYRADLTPKHRAVMGSRVFDIQAVLEAVPKRETHLLVVERV